VKQPPRESPAPVGQRNTAAAVSISVPEADPAAVTGCQLVVALSLIVNL
jgi:hypothetical protein